MSSHAWAYRFDLFAVLGMDRHTAGAPFGATWRPAVRTAYLRRCLQLHPDRGGSTEAFAVLEAANTILTSLVEYNAWYAWCHAQHARAYPTATAAPTTTPTASTATMPTAPTSGPTATAATESDGRSDYDDPRSAEFPAVVITWAHYLLSLASRIFHNEARGYPRGIWVQGYRDNEPKR